MQAVTVLLLELSFGSIHVPEKEQGILEAAKKGVRWLYSMSEYNVASRRAWQLCDMNLRKIALGMNYDVSDIPAFAYEHKPEQSIDTTPNGTSNQPQNHPSNDSTATLFKTTDVAEQAQSQSANLNNCNNNNNNNPFSGVQQQPDLPVSDVIPFSDAPHNGDAYFPYDPINGEFINYFFPNFQGEENQDQLWGS